MSVKFQEDLRGEQVRQLEVNPEKEDDVYNMEDEYDRYFAELDRMGTL